MEKVNVNGQEISYDVRPGIIHFDGGDFTDSGGFAVTEDGSYLMLYTLPPNSDYPETVIPSLYKIFREKLHS